MQSNRNRALSALLTLLFLAVSASASELVFFAGKGKADWISLPHFSAWKEFQGEDSTVGKIELSFQKNIRFDIGCLGAGNYVEDNRYGEYEWVRSEVTEEGLKINIGYRTKDKMLNVTLPDYCVNFYLRARSKDTQKRALKIIRTFDYDAYRIGRRQTKEN